MNERKHKDVPTSELLDFAGQQIPFEDTDNREKLQEYESELENREPFDDIKRALDRHTEQLRQLTAIVGQLVDHQHNCADGKPSVDLKKAIGQDTWRY